MSFVAPLAPAIPAPVGASPFATLLDPIPLQVGAPPPWPGYKSPPKPKLSEVLAAAERERDLHEPRIQQGYEMMRRYGQDPTLRGTFIRDLQKVISGENTTFPDPALRNETDGILNFIAQMDWTVEALYRLSIEKEEAASKEDAAVYLQENAQRQFARGGGTVLKYRKGFDLLIFGMIAEFIGVDVDNSECGLELQILDPTTVFPIWEGQRGLTQVYLKYVTAASNVIGKFSRFEKFNERAVRAAAGGKDYDPNYQGEVVEYWDRDHYLIAWESKQILLGSHDYHEVPFVITPGNFDQPSGITSPHLMRRNDGAFWSSDRAEDYKRIYAPFLQREVPLHELKEAVVGHAVTEFRKAANKPLNVFAEQLDFEEDRPLERKEASVNKFRQETRIEAVDNLPDPNIAQLVIASITQAEAMSRPSNLIAGNAPMSQGSGTALNVLGRAGQEKWAAPVLVIEAHETRVIETCFSRWLHYGDILGMDGNRGVLFVPRTKPNELTGDAAAHEVTPDLLKSTGIRVKVQLRRFNPDDLPSLAQGVGMLKSLNLIPDRDAIDIVGYTTDIEGAMQAIRQQKLEEVPAIIKMRTLSELVKLVKQAQERGDWESMEQALADVTYVASELEIEQFNQEMQLMQTRMARQQLKMGQFMTQLGGGMGQMGGGGMMGPQMQGLSMPDFGMQPGTEGGNLPGANGPQMNPALGMGF
jgi:hypothetical protein